MAYDRHISIADAIKSYYALPRNHRVHWSKARKDDLLPRGADPLSAEPQRVRAVGGRLSRQRR